MNRLKKWAHDNGVSPVDYKAGGRRYNTRSYTAEDVTAVVNFLVNFAEENAVFLPGRVPGYKSAEVKLLPSSMTKAEVWRTYKDIMEGQGNDE